MTVKGLSYHATVNIEDEVAKFVKVDKFSDQSIFAVDAENNQHMQRAQ